MSTMQEHVSLALHSTMRLGGTARYLVELHDKAALTDHLGWAAENNLPVIMIGQGSNIIWKDDEFNGLVVVNKLRGVLFETDGEDTLLTVAAGEPWDNVVAQACERGLNGIAELSLIPGTAGATPVQNVGAYGREIADVLVGIEAYDTESRGFVTLHSEDCAFGYRTSRFKTDDRGRFYITAITLQLSKTSPQPPYYQAVEDYLVQHKLSDPTVMNIRQAVIAIRSQKLPDPATVANNGSFFGNPIITQEAYDSSTALQSIKAWPLEDGMVKLSAAALLEQSGFKNHHDSDTGMATWPAQPLVLVNESAKQTADLLAYRQRIVNAVREKFGIELEQEPELLP
ncbi:UDP-N-acetylmuramate dehydrogenase [Patescibacteria group bacterium]|nr:MAG: UDP-N-acetylmuramate dehydrogenase [Patescibacteria group bacterium]